MTMFSFRLDDEEADQVRQWSDRLGIPRSALVREAVHRHLVRLRAEAEIAAWEEEPMSPEESAIASLADWGTAEDWSDWRDAAG